MIKETIYYECVCDFCGERLELDGVTAWESEEDAEEAMTYCGWETLSDGKHSCDSCLDSDAVTLLDGAEEEE